MPSHPAEDPSSTLLAALERIRRHHAGRAADPVLARRHAAIGRWQARRLRRTYADLEALPRYKAAIRFFESDLYGGVDFLHRDTDLARVIPVMNRLLPDSVIATVAMAASLNALSFDLDAALGRELASAGTGSVTADDVPESFTVAQYCAAYRAAGHYDDRVLQIRMVGTVGVALDRYVHKPMLRRALALMHKPAHAAGLGALQDFLERGFDAFAGMGGAVEFLATIETRERAVHDAILGGSDTPFPNPDTQEPA